MAASITTDTAPLAGPQPDIDQLDNAAGRAFRLYLAARADGRSSQEIAALKSAYDAALARARRGRMNTRIGSLDATIAA